MAYVAAAQYTIFASNATVALRAQLQSGLSHMMRLHRLSKLLICITPVIGCSMHHGGDEVVLSYI